MIFAIILPLNTCGHPLEEGTLYVAVFFVTIIRYRLVLYTCSITQWLPTQSSRLGWHDNLILVVYIIPWIAAVVWHSFTRDCWCQGTFHYHFPVIIPLDIAEDRHEREIEEEDGEGSGESGSGDVETEKLYIAVKVLYTPDTPLTRSIMEKANRIFKAAEEIEGWAGQVSNCSQFFLDTFPPESPVIQRINDVCEGNTYTVCLLTEVFILGFPAFCVCLFVCFICTDTICEVTWVTSSVEYECVSILMSTLSHKCHLLTHCFLLQGVTQTGCSCHF